MILRATELSRSYLQGDTLITAVQNFSHDFGPGVTAIVGPSGSGKTTLLNLLAGFDTPTTGEVLLGGQAFSSLSEDQRAEQRLGNMGFVFQQWNLIPTLTALENVTFPLLLAGVNSKERLQRGSFLLDSVGLAHRRDHLPNRLSGGEQQRVAIARSFATEPKVIFADEPTGNLDTVSGEVVAKLLLERGRQGTAVLLVTHSLELARRADSTITLRDGEQIS